MIDLNNVPNKPPPPSKPPKTNPPPTKPKGKDRVTVNDVNDVQWPGIDCPKKLLVAALLTAKALFVHWRELPALWRETGELNR